LKGRTDPLIREHVSRDLELLLFYRTKKYQHPGAAFTFVGVFRYIRESGSQPTSFVLERVSSRDPIGVRRKEAGLESALDAPNLDGQKDNTRGEIAGIAVA